MSRFHRTSNGLWIIRGRRAYGIIWGFPVWWFPTRQVVNSPKMFSGTAWGWGLLAIAKASNQGDAHE